MSSLEIENLHVSIEGKEIVKGISLKVEQGKVHAIMGPNGSGKSTLAYTIMGHPKYTVNQGSIKLDGKELNELTPDERAKTGVFLGFQYPLEIPGVGFVSFLRNSYNNIHSNGKKISVIDFQNMIKEKIKQLNISDSLLSRSLNEGFSGGEKKRAEVLQLSVINPKIAILDEPDSGLDIDALKNVAEAINDASSKGIGLLIITHYQRILKYIKPDYVHIMVDGKIIKSGGKELAQELEERGYNWAKNIGG